MTEHKIKLSSDKVHELLMAVRAVILENRARFPQFRLSNDINDFIIELKDIIQENGYDEDIVEVSVEQLSRLKKLVLTKISDKENQTIRLDLFNIAQKLEYLVWGQFQREISLIKILND